MGGADSHGALPVPLVARLSVVMVPRQSITPVWPVKARLTVIVIITGNISPCN